MLILLSPSKTLDYTAHYPKIPAQLPQFLPQTQQLLTLLKPMQAADITRLMGVSEALAELNYQRFQSFSKDFTPQNSRPCLFAFRGDVYDGLDAASLSPAQCDSAQRHIRILSGLYGLLRPYDLMQPYRLEMGTKLAGSHGKNLYDFWGSRLSKALNAEASEAIINLASQEYFKAVQPKALKAPLLTPVFKERKGNQLKVVGIYAKKARGWMARHLVSQPKAMPLSEKITSFTEGGYCYDEALSHASEYVFVR